MEKKGVTLIELLVVIAVIGILASIAIPAYVGQQRRAARSEAFLNLETLRMLQEQYYAENGEYADKAAGSNGTLSGVDQIDDKLPAFKPGPEANLSFTYSITYTLVGTNTTSFIANAIGKSNTKVTGDSFWINSNNAKNF